MQTHICRWGGPQRTCATRSTRARVHGDLGLRTLGKISSVRLTWKITTAFSLNIQDHLLREDLGGSEELTSARASALRKPAFHSTTLSAQTQLRETKVLYFF